MDQALCADRLMYQSPGRIHTDSGVHIQSGLVSLLFLRPLQRETNLSNARTLPMDRSMLPPPSAELLKFVRERAAPQSGRAELRRSKRYAAVLEVVVVPLNEHYRPSGLPFLAVTRDVSTGGLCMLHTRPAPSSLLFIEIERPNVFPLEVVLNVRRNRRVGQFFEIAGEFVPIADDALAAAKARLATRRPEKAV